MELTHAIMYQASLDKDTTFEGLFYTAVKTTGIFCRPSCTARKPKKENVEFLQSVKECISKGYRPCKVCRPLEKLDETPGHIKQLLDELMEKPSIKLKDYDLVKKGMEPSQVRRWFLKHHGITFQAYQRMLRINAAFKKIQGGETVTGVAFDCGFESLSGFGDSFKTILGTSPKNSRQTNIIDLKRIETPLGTMITCASEKGICLLEFTDRKMLESELKSLSKALGAPIIQGNNEHFKILEEQLQDYFDGNRKEFTVPLHLIGTSFQREVWEVLKTISYGHTRSYKELATGIQRLDHTRAVANANGMNKISILIPCHRVIGSDGRLTGYGGGIWRKRYLLELESKNK